MGPVHPRIPIPNVAPIVGSLRLEVLVSWHLLRFGPSG
jgi:hypothetical protein